LVQGAEKREKWGRAAPVEELGKVVYTVEYLLNMMKLASHLTLAISLELGCLF